MIDQVPVDFALANQTVILSDIHLSEAEPPHPNNPLWKRYKRKKFFIDQEFSQLVDHLIEAFGTTNGEMILNGDIFDFDSITQIPRKIRSFRIGWLEKKRGLNAEEQKSRFKIDIILSDHKLFIEALRRFILAGNRLVFVIGNHDMELHWPAVQLEILKHLNLSEHYDGVVRFCEWFYISNGDTLIEHGNQYDPYCLCQDPVHPFIRKGFKSVVRLPFGNMASRYMVNGMGLINPHAETSFIMGLNEWLIFFYRYIVRVQPLLALTYIWSALVTFLQSILEGFLPSIKDPLSVEKRVDSIAIKANATPSVVRSLRELHVHSAVFNPFKILRELWLDRVLFLFLILVGSFQLFAFLNVFTHLNFSIFLLIFGLLIPVLVYYGKQVKPELNEVQTNMLEKLTLIREIVGVNRVITGHTHRERHLIHNGVEFINTGTWSPAFKDPECTIQFGQKCIAWIKTPATSDQAIPAREAGLYEWSQQGLKLIPVEKDKL